MKLRKKDEFQDVIEDPIEIYEEMIKSAANLMYSFKDIAKDAKLNEEEVKKFFESPVYSKEFHKIVGLLGWEVIENE